jgi:formylglycine-generating enzyme required for sulfatase activity
MDIERACRPTIPVVPTSRRSTVAETDCTEINLHRVGGGTLRAARIAVRFVVAAAATAQLHGVAQAQSLSTEQERALKPKDAFRECDACPEMVVVPAGSFMMGSPPNEQGRAVLLKLRHEPDVNLEGPQHRVTFARPFAVGKFAVTFDEWDACAADGGCNGYRPLDWDWGRGKQPVINVSWNDAKAYVVWLSRKTGKKYRLLTEAEREYVTRAGTKTRYWWGTSISPQQANYKTAPFVPFSKQRAQPVGSFQPNPWGLYQVHGNLYDWVEDCWTESYGDTRAVRLASIIEPCLRHVIRGGCYDDPPDGLRSAARGWGGPPNRRMSIVGFRVARTLGPDRVSP